VRLVASGAVAIALLAGCGGSDTHSSGGAHRTGTTCSSVIDHIMQGAKDYGARDYAGGYNNADRAVHLLAGCPDKRTKVGLSGAALSVRGWNEHHLAKGDSMADMRLAYALLKTCIDDAGTPPEVLDLCTRTSGMDAQVTAGW